MENPGRSESDNAGTNAKAGLRQLPIIRNRDVPVAIGTLAFNRFKLNRLTLLSQFDPPCNMLIPFKGCQFRPAKVPGDLPNGPSD
jgi:hypothetical protein